MATAQDVIDEAAALLNDPSKSRWDFAVLLPFLQKAHRELQMALSLAGLPVIKKTSAVITVPALTIDLTAPTGGGGSLQPSDLLEPEDIEEKQTGSTTDLFAPMHETTWEVDTVQSTTLRFWNWTGEKIRFLGATVAVDIKLHYIGGLAVPASEGDSLGFLSAQLFLGPRTAAIAAASVGNSAAFQLLNSDAEFQKSKVLRFNIKGMQGVPKRRIPYRRGRVRRIF